uniref:sensor histidine kinase n=1 Tax=Synechococcus sp. CS-1329 TaxID=2847975 RepID=UPI00223AA52B|nr:HAMP domain-containing sensor histidine kinase [Synechococcus sp. CS-1329]
MKPALACLSLYRRLRPYSLLAVLAGFGLLILANQNLLDLSRARRHRQATDLVVRELLARSSSATPTEFHSKLDQILSPGRLLWLELEPGRPYRQPRLSGALPLPVPFPQLVATVERRCVGDDHLVGFAIAERRYLCSSKQINFSGRPAVLRVVEDISSDVERRRLLFLLLLAHASAACLLTTGALWLLFRWTLRPLTRLCTELGQIDSESLEQMRLSIQNQPPEIEMIVASFNALLDRLAAARGRQQTFVDGVAHELRTPITLISGYSQSLKRQSGACAANKAVQGITREAERMGRMVSELLDIAREEAGRLRLGRDPLDLDDALLVAFERLQPLAPDRLRLRLPQEGSPPWGLGDGERLQQCLTNLVENALKYTPKGSPIELYSSAGATEVVLHVRDNGPGVPLAEQERIFERFVRGTSQADTSGSGIGLAMVRLLMRRMGGDVRVASAPGGGADFQLVLERVGLRSSIPPL